MCKSETYVLDASFNPEEFVEDIKKAKAAVGEATHEDGFKWLPRGQGELECHSGIAKLVSYTTISVELVRGVRICIYIYIHRHITI